MKKIYLDSNVFISLILQDFGKGFKLMYARTDEFFEKCTGFQFIISCLFVEESKRKTYYSLDELIAFFNERKISFILVFPCDGDSDLALRLVRQGMHYSDALHAAFALRLKCDYLVTWNERDFELLEGKIKVVNPSHFL
ncbi:PIN domain-containing protein [archaeon]|nr:PIN domain-containing protein [archaeon]